MKIAIAITGASGSIYAKVLFDLLQKHQRSFQNIDVVMSKNAMDVWQHELGNSDYKNYPFRFFDKYDFRAPFASGSAGYHALVVIPCSILVTRETPLNLIQIRNMATVTEAGGIICPATPSFYSQPKTIEDVALTVVHRVVDLLGLDIDSYRWGK